MTRYTKKIKLQLSGEADAVDAAIGILHVINFISAHEWSQTVRKRGEPTVVRVAAREIMLEG
ncbi:hypothetical protein [Alkalinema sp. FACHB-956]|uniref:hypothetical protein n=1 Tax=Alkalinema sp. FACHB-956 TaxID=2692768 RepID=UPI0016846FB3|nr:hypothetical protein [Alkalinema sp. FACHB-956]MBD2328183.1 hypothetical protein [Alkalinema sp. FACHB-956]